MIIVILTFPFSRISISAVSEYPHHCFYSSGFEFDFQFVRPDDSPGIKRLKKLAAHDATQLENLPEDLKTEKGAETPPR